MTAKAAPVVLVVILVLLGSTCRWTSLPIYHGAVDAPAPTRSTAISAPFGDDLHGSCDSFLTILARSLSREGLLATGGIPLLNLAAAQPEGFRYYDHHPPGVPLCTAWAFHWFGERESTARGLALAFATLLSVALLCALRNAPSAALVAAGLAGSVLPISSYWGTHLNFELPTMALGTVAVLLATGDSKSDPTARRRGALLFLALSCLMDLVGLFAATALALEALRRHKFAEALRWVAWAAGLYLLWSTWKYLQISRHGMSFGGADRAHLFKVSFLSWFTGNLAFVPWLRAVAGHCWTMSGGWPVLVLVIELVTLAVQRPAKTTLDRRLLVFSLWALFAIVVPAQRSFDHPYYVLYLWMPLVLAFARLTARAYEFATLATPRSKPLVGVVWWTAIAATGIAAEWRKPPPSVDRDSPSAHRLGREFLEFAAGRHCVIVIPPSTAVDFDLITVSCYARTLVAELDPTSETSKSALAQVLAAYGMSLDRFEVWLAKDEHWPGRGGWQRLHPPP